MKSSTNRGGHNANPLFSAFVKALLSVMLLLVGNVAVKAADFTSAKSVTFNEGVRYSQWVIDSRLSDFWANKNQMGFNVLDKDGNVVKSSANSGNLKFDYVPGLVAKAVLEAQAFYDIFDWSKPWFKTVEKYATDKKYTVHNADSKSDITLDNMNACKMYFPLMASSDASENVKGIGKKAIADVITDMGIYNGYYVIGGDESGLKEATATDAQKKLLGGWWHKPIYKDQMWCDGLYMGAALLAQIIKYNNSETNVDGTSDWDLITKQFTISWSQLNAAYGVNDGVLLYHAFTANPGDDDSSYWTGIDKVNHSEAFWGRACGWYFLALVDVLEQMPETNANYATLHGYLKKLAAGLKNCQDDVSGCWYQVLDEKENPLDGNYLESSCTAIFTAAYLKAMRLGLLDKTTYEATAIKAYKGFVEQFMKYDTDGTVQLIHNCKTAGLSGIDKRNGSRAYYVDQNDEAAQSNGYTEGKVLGAFILAATEYEREYQNASVLLHKDLAPSYSLKKGESLSIEASGSGFVTYQWYKDGSIVEGATSPSFEPEVSGSYYCIATPAAKAAGTIQSSTAEVTVEGTIDPTPSGNATISWIEMATTTHNADKAGVSTNTAITANKGVISSGLSTNNTITQNGTTWYCYNGFDVTEDKNIYFEYSYIVNSGTFSPSKISVSWMPNGGKAVSFNLYGVDDGGNMTFIKKLIHDPDNTYGTDEISSSDATINYTKFRLVPYGKSGSNIVLNNVVIEGTLTGGSTEPTTYTVTYNMNGHGDAIDAVKDVTTLPETLPTPTATGYTFEGWYLDEALANKAVAGDKITDNTILYAKWTPNTVVADGLIEEFAMSSKREDGSWYGDKGTEIKVSGVVYRDAGYMKLAQKTGINSLSVPQGYTVSKIVLTVKSSSKSDPTEIEVGGIKQTVSTSVSDIEYDITDVEGAVTITIKNIGSKDAELTGIKVYGTAPQVGDYTITYVTKIGEEPAQQEKVSVLKAEYLPKLSVDGYVFGGWYTDEACTEENKAVEGTVLNSDITLYAKWTVSETKKAIVLKYITTDGKTVFEGTSQTISSFTSPTLKAYVANADGTASNEDVTTAVIDNVEFMSDVEDVATVSTSGVITIKDNATGGAKVYAKFAGNDNYAAAETFFNIIITSGYSYKVESGNSAPKIRDTHDIKDGNDKELLKITFGGWNLNSNTYNVPGSSDAKKDSWSSAKTEKGIASIDGYSYFFQGANDAKDEAIGEGEFYGSTRYGWFVPRDKEAEGTAGGTHPFTLPVRGSYVTLEPTVNGTLTVYILQNGAWNTDKNYKIIKGEFRTHSFHVVNQRGLPVKYFSQNGYSVTTKQTVEDGYTCDLSKINDPVDNNSTNIALWEEFRTKFDEDMQKTIEANWNNGINGAQTIIELDDHSFLAIQKGIVKYTFHVMAKETYYFFSNFSKMGFSGVNFIPDKNQPDEINYPVLELSDTEKYVAPEKKSDGFYVAGKKCFEVDSSTPIGGKEIVAKVPQFAKITVNRTFKANQWTTISLPFNIMGSRVEEIFGAGTEIIMLDNATVSNGAARLHFIYHEIQNILPGYPYLIKPTKDVNGFEITNKYINPEMAQVDMDCGDYVAKMVAGYSTGDLTNTANGKSGYSVKYGENDIFVSDSDGKLYVSAGNSFGKGYRSYIAKKPGTPAAKSISMSYSGVDDSDYNIPTEIKFVELAPEAVKAFGFSGVYNLNGQYVGDTTENLPAGVYIANGRKIVIK